MAVVCRVKPNAYMDSLVLMRVATKVREMPGVIDVVMVMGTPKNKETVPRGRLRTREVESSGPDDLVFVVEAESEKIADLALKKAEELLFSPSFIHDPSEKGLITFRSLPGAFSASPGANLALISIPGPYVKAEALKALRMGLHLMIFSDNVPLDDEAEIKRSARERGLLVMGPDCGTALINGTALGFANRVSRGPVGIVGASGTGIQEASCLLDRWGSGVSHAIGTGSNDVKDEIGGITMQAGIDLLLQDTFTEVIILISKPPGPGVQGMLLEKIAAVPGKFIVHFQGAKTMKDKRFLSAPTLAETAAAALGACGLRTGIATEGLSPHSDIVRAGCEGLKSDQTLISGVFCGGTFCGEAAGIILRESGEVHTNSGYPGTIPLPDDLAASGHVCIDMGDDRFTRGRPHPMLEPSVMGERILMEAEKPRVAVLLLDLVLGFGAHSDPAGVLVPILEKALYRSLSKGRRLAVVAHVCGTDRDPQVRRKQVERLREAGVLVAEHNAGAAKLACRIANRESHQSA